MQLDDEKTEEAAAAGFKEKYKAFVNWMLKNLPFSADIQWALLNYGIGISAFFSFYRFVVLNSFIMFAAYGYFIIKHLISFDTSYSAVFSYGLPKFTMFSMFEPNTANGIVFTIPSP